MLARLNGALGGVIDDESFTLSQSYYYGHLYECAEFRVEITEGEPLDLCDHLDRIAIGKSARHQNSGNGPDPQWQRGDASEFRRRIVSGESLHPSVASYVGQLAHDGVPKHGAIDSINLLFDEHHVPRYAGRRGEVLKIIDYVYDKETKKQAPETANLHSIRADKVKMTAVKWLWPGRFAYGKLGLVSGLPDEGKGQFLWFVAARATRGGSWPCGEGEASIGDVLVLQCEDDLSDTVVPRLVAAGADLSRIHIVSMVRTESGGSRMLNLAQDLAMLRRKIEEIGNISIVLIDPLSAYMGRTKEVDTFRTTDVRNVLSPLAALAAELDVAIISIMHFNKKTDVNNVLLRVSDSGAFTAQSRHLYGVVSDPEDKARKLLVRGKNNLAPAGQKSLAYRFATQLVGTDAKSGEEIWAPYIMFDPEAVDIDPAEAMNNGMGRPKDQRNKAKDWLRGKLAMGELCCADLVRDAKNEEDISRATLFRARDELKIISAKRGSEIYWSLPTFETG
jgi:hypothetical protein